MRVGSEDGGFPVTVRATDSTGGVAERAFTLRVVLPPLSVATYELQPVPDPPAYYLKDARCKTSVCSTYRRKVLALPRSRTFKLSIQSLRLISAHGSETSGRFRRASRIQ